MWILRKKRHHSFHTIPPDAQEAILELAKEYPNVGQQGLQHEVERLGFNVDPHELKLFLRDHGHPSRLHASR